MALLNGRFALHDVKDVEKLVRRVVENRTREWGAVLNPTQKDDATVYLIETAWELSRKYDPERGISFSTYAYRMLRLRLADWYRKTFGDSRRGPQPTVYSFSALDAETISDAGEQMERATERVAFQQECDQLSERSEWIVEAVARPLSHGVKLDDVARSIGGSRKTVASYMAELRRELQGQRTIEDEAA